MSQDRFKGIGSNSSNNLTGNTPTKSDSSTLYIPPHLRSNSTDYDDHSDRIPSVSSDMDEDQQQQYYYYHRRSSMDQAGGAHPNVHSQPPIIKSKQQIIDYMNQHKIASILKTKLNEAFQQQSLDPIEYIFRTKRVVQHEILIQQRQSQMKEMDIKHDEVLSSIQQSKESMKQEYEKLEKDHLQEISTLKAEIEQLKIQAAQVENQPESQESLLLEKTLEQLKTENEELEKENQSLLKRIKESSNNTTTTTVHQHSHEQVTSNTIPEETQEEPVDIPSTTTTENAVEDDSADPFATE
ncbi:predicted protein [Naegleria gruberi]|uniref:Predicted protein n=1 Tax=Naegleria gruberi TaxID=5762 RepID=D2VNP1_NAEGR|nr:uncharacterized protein NAEGRDRAFT_51044 [Naegleria gruberi]EFC41442.1 predicted protein [Naegleria gruberi]|eukprot:XP_002674186.1 predicted protein [Naegleria gruberi strain NEG-M]